jgi:predicted kinase
LLCGLPGAGKTTLAKRLAAKVPAVRLGGDEWMAELGIGLHDEEARARLGRLFWLHAQDLLRLGLNVVLESGFWLRSDGDEKRLGARALGVAVELHYLEVPFESLCRRLERRKQANVQGAVPITREMMERWVQFLQPPTGLS